eukprot:TRINITY_DN741_c0_g1_i3.p1 TRINITY_DN741_c0_g1~~TRINITY_DN741_c0_g1_i3.p1  ORF type:complete len:211 (-),score=17.51 TRINITY_DN741_c0_g1_i3:2568-3200(-)
MRLEQSRSGSVIRALALAICQLCRLERFHSHLEGYVAMQTSLLCLREPQSHTYVRPASLHRHFICPYHAVIEPDRALSLPWPLADLIMIGQSTCTVALFCILCACASAKSLRGGRHQQRRLKISPDYQGTPYEANPIAIPGMLQVELFDKGGEGVGYHDIKDPAAKAKAPPNVIRQDSPIQINDEGPDVNGSEAVGQIGIGMGIGGEWLR